MTKNVKAGDIVRIVKGVSEHSDKWLASWGIGIGSIHTIINDGPTITERDKREGWLGIYHQGNVYTIEHFVLELVKPVAEPTITNKGNTMHIESMPRQYKLILGTEDISLFIAALLHAASDGSTWQEATKEKVREYAKKLDNAKKGV